MTRFAAARLQGVARGTRPTAINLKWALDEDGWAAVARPPAPPSAWRPPYARRRRDQRGRISPSTRAIGRHGLALIEDHRGEEKKARRAGKTSSPTAMPGLARHRRPVGTGDRADLHGARQGRACPCLGRRDAPAATRALRSPPGKLGQHGRFAHRVIPDKHRRPPDAGAGLVDHGDRGRRPGGAQRRTSANKIGTYLQGAGGRTTNAIPFYVGLPSPTIDFTIPGTGAIFRSRSATPGRFATHDGPHRRGGRHRDHFGSFRRARMSPITDFDRDPGAARDRPDHRARALIAATPDALAPGVSRNGGVACRQEGGGMSLGLPQHRRLPGGRPAVADRACGRPRQRSVCCSRSACPASANCRSGPGGRADLVPGSVTTADHLDRRDQILDR